MIPTGGSDSHRKEDVGRGSIETEQPICRPKKTLRSAPQPTIIRSSITGITGSGCVFRRRVSPPSAIHEKRRTSVMPISAPILSIPTSVIDGRGLPPWSGGTQSVAAKRHRSVPASKRRRKPSQTVNVQRQRNGDGKNTVFRHMRQLAHIKPYFSTRT